MLSGHKHALGFRNGALTLYSSVKRGKWSATETVSPCDPENVVFRQKLNAFFLSTAQNEGRIAVFLSDEDIHQIPLPDGVESDDAASIAQAVAKHASIPVDQLSFDTILGAKGQEDRVVYAANETLARAEAFLQNYGFNIAYFSCFPDQARDRPEARLRQGQHSTSTPKRHRLPIMILATLTFIANTFHGAPLGTLDTASTLGVSTPISTHKSSTEPEPYILNLARKSIDHNTVDTQSVLPRPMPQSTPKVSADIPDMSPPSAMQPLRPNAPLGFQINYTLPIKDVAPFTLTQQVSSDARHKSLTQVAFVSYGSDWGPIDAVGRPSPRPFTPVPALPDEAPTTPDPQNQVPETTTEQSIAAPAVPTENSTNTPATAAPLPSSIEAALKDSASAPLPEQPAVSETATPSNITPSSARALKRPPLRPQSFAALPTAKSKRPTPRPAFIGPSPKLSSTEEAIAEDLLQQAIIDDANRKENIANASRLALNGAKRPARRPSNLPQIKVATATVVKPAPKKPATVANTAPEKETRASTTFNKRSLSLVGVFGTPSNRKAMFRTSTGGYRTIKPGQSVSGWKLVGVSESSVKVAKGSRSKTLRMPE
ncbi:hypothetical protein GCM10007939_09090 [Amylibacter marinus]|uniref:Type IV pilus biogenesis protein PilP n=1 Tax=Amylibacter marinus TaxID=1475483 RepID=A0ABQ5VTY5_9RHOB|nr:hypothetical protein [Amylibacter marinus]GLQ34626.1 hypothetical protein GCM10007939_09090 [Amylibacter marinus]